MLGLLDSLDLTVDLIKFTIPRLRTLIYQFNVFENTKNLKNENTGPRDICNDAPNIAKF